MEKEKKKFKILNYIWIIPLILGIIIGINGIAKINTSNSIQIPSMGQDGWFEATTSQSSTRFSGIVTCVIGFFVIGLMGTIFCYSIPRHFSNVNKQFKQIESAIDSELKQKTQNEKNTKLKKCVYCGSLCKIDATECESCGGKEFKKYKH